MLLKFHKQSNFTSSKLRRALFIVQPIFGNQVAGFLSVDHFLSG